MGSLRLLLAISVVAFHSKPIFGWQGMRADAVQAFFILSGFYMALILESGRYATARAFYESRALRLFPVYWAFLLVYVAIAITPSIPGSEFLGNVTHAARSRVMAATDGSPAAWLTAVPNLFFVGSDWARQFLYDDAGNLFLWRPGMLETSAHAVERHLVMPQIWSLGVELVFYAVAPFLVRLSTRSLVVVGVVAYIVGNVAQGVGATYDGPFQWRHMLPMQNAWLFVLGVVCFRAMPLAARLPTWASVALASVPFAICLLWSPRSWNEINALLSVFALGVPSLFVLTKDWRADRWVGELAYPIYITHFLFAWSAGVYGQYAGYVCLTISVVISIILMRYVQEPIDRYRARLATPAIA